MKSSLVLNEQLQFNSFLEINDPVAKQKYKEQKKLNKKSVFSTILVTQIFLPLPALEGLAPTLVSFANPP